MNAIKVVYKEQLDGTWIGTDGSKAVTTPYTKENPTRWDLFNKDGKLVQKINWFDELPYPHECFSYYDRYKRTIGVDGDIKYDPAHFPVGTKVEAAEHHHRKSTFKELTVARIIQNGPRSYCLEMEEEDTRLAQEAGCGKYITLNIAHIRRIISRGKGPVLLVRSGNADTPAKAMVGIVDQKVKNRLIAIHDGDESVVPKCRKGEFLFYETGGAMYIAVSYMPEAEYRVINENRMWHFVKHGPFSRPVGSFMYFGEPTTIYAISKSKYLKWLEKNVHRILTRLDEDESIARDNNKEAWADLDWEMAV